MHLSLIYSPHNDVGVRWFSGLHLFDGRKYSKAWAQVLKARGSRAEALVSEIPSPIGWDQLIAVHDAVYLKALHSKSTIVQALELPAARLIPMRLIEKYVIRPMLYACHGTILGAEAAMGHGGIAFHFGGGFHHAHRDHGEGFCLFADIPIAIKHLVNKGMLKSSDKVLIVDLDAHRGNGFESICEDWPVEFLDLYNFQIYPGLKDDQPERFPFLVPMRSGGNGEVYLNTLRAELPKFLEIHADAKLAFFNAGTDILTGDPLGRLAVDAESVLERDRFVISALQKHQLPGVVCTSGGYTKRSADLMAQTAIYLIDEVRG